MYLLDSDILLYSLKGHAAVVASLKRHRGNPMAVSVVSPMEPHCGARKSEEPRGHPLEGC